MTLVTGTTTADPSFSMQDDVDATDPAGLDQVMDDVVGEYIILNGYDRETIPIILRWEGTEAGPFERRLDALADPPPAPPPAVVTPTVATVEGLSPIGVTEVIAGGYAEFAAVDTLPDGWTISEDNKALWPTEGVYMAALNISVTTSPDVPFEIDVSCLRGISATVPVKGFVDAGVSAETGTSATGGPFIVTEAGVIGSIQAWMSYVGVTDPTVGEITWQLTVWRIADPPT